ncbi:cytochrome P450 6k1-like [Cydia strobilella]|uniref:cytochrome P450 6k1-like n=1 Tax=Cydia strobilella TaxID=1100964 RepID=UPI003007C82E
MLLTLLVAVFASLLAILYIQHRKNSRFWAERGVPHSPPHPLLGNFDCFFKQNVGIWMRDLHAKFQAPLTGIWVFRQPVLVVADPEVSKRILLSDSDLFRNRYLASGKSDPVGGLNIFTIRDPAWSNIRRRITYIFTAAKLKAMHGLLSSKSKATVNRIRQDKANNKTTEIRTLFTDYTTDIIGTSLFGMQNDAVGTGDSALRAVTREFMRFDWFRGLSIYSIFFWPALVDIFRFSFFPRKSVDFFRKTVSTIIEHRTTNNLENNDLLDALVKMKKEKLDDGQEFSDDLLAAQATIMLQGGFDTSAVALTLMVNELAHNSKIQDKLYKELSEGKKKKDGADFSFSDLEKLVYLNCVIKESLRKYPAMGWLDRICSTDYKITDTVTLPANTPIFINAMGMHHDPKFFPEPYKFDPDRFLPENKQNFVPFSYMPFGDGPRMCIGKRFAQMSLRYLLAELVQSMEFRPLPCSTKPNEVNFEPKAPFLMPEHPISVEFIPRN